MKQDTSDLNSQVKYLKKIIGQSKQINDSTWLMPWELTYNYDSLNSDYIKGETTVGVMKLDGGFKLNHLDTRLLSRETQIELTFGQRVVDDKLNIFLQTNYPGFSPSVMEGTMIDPNDNKYIKSLLKKNKWFPNTWNVGLGATVGYDFLHNQPAIVVGANLTYSLYQW